MANEKILNSRLLLKYDTLAAWQSSAFNGDDASKYLKAGEAAVVVVNTWKLDKDGNQIAVPTCLMKIGDGENKFDDLNWTAAQAADVYEWAKKAAPDWADFDVLPTDKLPEIPWTKIPEIPADKQSKDYGKVTADTGSIEADEVQDTFAINGDNKYISTSAQNDSVTISLKESEIKSLIASETTAAMEFKGVTATLPSPTEDSAKGDMYKVTATFEVADDKDAQGAGFTAKSGDSIVYEGNNKWFLIPSGDDVEDTWRHVKVNNEQVLGNGVNANEYLHIENGTSNANNYASFKVNNKTVKAEVVGYKTIQNIVNDPTASGSTLAFIDTISQDENGVISATKKNVDLSNYATKSEIPTVSNAEITIEPENGLELTDGSDGKFNLNQPTNETISIGIKNKGVSAEKTKAYIENYGDDSEEVWVFYSGTSTILV